MNKLNAMVVCWSSHEMVAFGLSHFQRQKPVPAGIFNAYCTPDGSLYPCDISSDIVGEGQELHQGLENFDSCLVFCSAGRRRG